MPGRRPRLRVARGQPSPSDGQGGGTPALVLRDIFWRHEVATIRSVLNTSSPAHTLGDEVSRRDPGRYHGREPSGPPPFDPFAWPGQSQAAAMAEPGTEDE